MKILLYKDLIVGFLSQNIEDKNLLKRVKNIFKNENLSFLYSKKLLSFLKNELGEEYELEYNALVTKLGDTGINILSSENSATFDDEFLNIYGNTKENIFLCIALNTLNQNIEIQLNTPKVAILTAENKPNYHWLVVELAIIFPNSLMVRHFHVNNDNEIDKLFYNLFSLPKTIARVNIFDDNCNFDHNKFTFLKKNKIKVHYYTARLSFLQNKERLEEMKKEFSSVLMFTKGAGGHAREIIFGGFIITSDNDFWGLNVSDNKKWLISIQYSPQEAEKALLYEKNYQRFSS